MLLSSPSSVRRYRAIPFLPLVLSFFFRRFALKLLITIERLPQITEQNRHKQPKTRVLSLEVYCKNCNFVARNSHVIKQGGEKHINAGAAAMIELAANIDTDKMPAPAFMAVIVAVGKYAYQRPDGVYVIPIGCLKD